MKTLALLLSSLLGTSACLSTTSAPAPHGEENQAFDLIPLQFAPADELAHTLGQLWPNARVLADARTNSLLVRCANEAELVQVRECVARLDVEVRAGK